MTQRSCWHVCAAGVFAWAGCGAELALGAIHLQYVAANPTVNVGSTVQIRLFATASSLAPEAVLSAQSIVTWNPSRLQLVSATTSAPNIFGGFLVDAYGLNESALPTDGNALYQYLGPLGSAGVAVPNPGGLLIATLNFVAISPTGPGGTLIDMPARGGNPTGITVVYGLPGANNDVTGTLSGTSVVIIPSPFAAAVLGITGGFVLSRRRR